MVSGSVCYMIVTIFVHLTLFFCKLLISLLIVKNILILKNIAWTGICILQVKRPTFLQIHLFFLSLFSFSEVLPVVDFQSTLALKIGLVVMSSLYANVCPRQYLQTMIGWLTGTQEDECIMGTHNASLDNPNDEQVTVMSI